MTVHRAIYVMSERILLSEFTLSCLVISYFTIITAVPAYRRWMRDLYILIGDTQMQYKLHHDAIGSYEECLPLLEGSKSIDDLNYLQSTCNNLGNALQGIGVSKCILKQMFYFIVIIVF